MSVMDWCPDPLTKFEVLFMNIEDPKTALILAGMAVFIGLAIIATGVSALHSFLG